MHDEEFIREMARRMGGGHPISEIRGKQDFITANKSRDPAVVKTELIIKQKEAVKNGND